MSDRTTLILFGCILICMVTAPGVLAAGEYDIEASNSVDTESRTVTVDGDDYEVESVGRVRVDDTLSVDVNSPDDEAAQVYLYNKERDIVEIRDQDGSSSVSIDMSGYAPGAYVLAVFDDENGTIEDIQPLVVAGWDTTLSMNTTSNDEVEQGDPLSATISINEYTDMPEPDSVEIVLTRDDSVVLRTDADKTSTGEYEATIDTDRETGTYRIYANVRNTTTVENRQEVVGVTDSHMVEIRSNVSESNGDSDATETDSNAGGGGAVGQPGSTATDTSTSSPTSVPTNNTSTTTQTTLAETPVSPSTTMTPTDSPSQRSTEPVSTTEDDTGLITVGSQTATPSSTPTSTPGFGILAGLVALVGSTLLLLRN